MTDFISSFIIGVLLVSSMIFLFNHVDTVRSFIHRIRTHNPLVNSILIILSSAYAQSSIIILSSALVFYVAYSITFPSAEVLVHLVLGFIFGTNSVWFARMSVSLLRQEVLQEGALFRVILAGSLTASPLILDILARFLKEESNKSMSLEIASVKLGISSSAQTTNKPKVSFNVEGRQNLVDFGAYMEPMNSLEPSFLRDIETAKKFHNSQEASFTDSYGATIDFYEAFVKPIAQCSILAKEYHMPLNTYYNLISPIATNIQNIVYDLKYLSKLDENFRKNLRNGSSPFLRNSEYNHDDQDIPFSRATDYKYEDRDIVKQVKMLQESILLYQERLSRSTEEFIVSVLHNAPTIKINNYINFPSRIDFPSSEFEKESIRRCFSWLNRPKYKMKFSLEELFTIEENPYTYIMNATLFWALNEPRKSIEILKGFDKNKAEYAANLTFLLSYITDEQNYVAETLVQIERFIQQLESRATARFENEDWIKIRPCSLSPDERLIWFRHFFVRAREINRYVYTATRARPEDLYMSRNRVLSVSKNYAKEIMESTNRLLSAPCLEKYTEKVSGEDWDKKLAAATFLDTYGIYNYALYLEDPKDTFKQEAIDSLRQAVSLAEASSASADTKQSLAELLAKHLSDVQAVP